MVYEFNEYSWVVFLKFWAILEPGVATEIGPLSMFICGYLNLSFDLVSIVLTSDLRFTYVYTYLGECC